MLRSCYSLICTIFSTTLLLQVLLLSHVLPNRVAAQYATADESLVYILQQAMNNTYILPDNVYEWNITKIEVEISRHSPNFWETTANPCLLVNALPVEIIAQLSPPLLIGYHLCPLVPDSYYVLNNISNSSCVAQNPCPSSINFCVALLQESKFQPNHISKYGQTSVGKTVTIHGVTVNVSLDNCGLVCDEGWKLLGIKPSTQFYVDLSKYISLVLAIGASLFLIINQYNDQKESHEKFTDKSLLYQLPYFITLAVFILIVCMAWCSIPQLQDRVLCNSDNSFSSMNPAHGKNPSCTIVGMIFYGSVTAYLSYTSLLSFVIFRQFYSPMKPLWGVDKRYWHVAVNSVVLFAIIVATSTSSIGAIKPMGICLPGTSTQESVLGFMLVPFALATAIVSGFLVSCVYLIKQRLKQQRHTVNIEHQNKMEDLAYRLLWYTGGVLITMLILMFMAAWVYTDFDRVREAFSAQAQCEIQNYYAALYSTPLSSTPSPECTRTVISPPILYIFWPLSCVSAVFAQVILTCHAERRTRFKRSMTRTGSRMRRLEQSVVHSLKRVRSRPDDGTLTEKDKKPGEASPEPDELNKVRSNSGNVEDRRRGTTQVEQDIILPTTYQPHTFASPIPRDSLVPTDVEITQFPRQSELKLDTYFEETQTDGHLSD